MTANKFNNKKPLTISNITTILTLLYIVLFEFTLVEQSLFPKPSLLIESFFSLWSEYNLLAVFLKQQLLFFQQYL